MLYDRTLSFIQLRGFFFFDGVGMVALQCVLVFAVPCSESVLCIHISSPFRTSLQPPLAPSNPTLLDHHRAPRLALCALERLPTSYFTHGSVYMSGLLSQLDHFCLITKLMHGDIKYVSNRGSTKYVQACICFVVYHIVSQEGV